MSAHTPGPWTLESPSMGFGGIYGPDGKIIFALAYARTDERPEAECEANARLIPAAPALLEALKDALPMMIAWAASYQHQHNLTAYASEHAAAINAIAAAIAQAEGRS